MTDEQFSRIAKAIADQRRFQILEQIAANGDVPCQQLVASFPVTQPTMSHHLRELSSAGLIEPRREGQCVHYRFLSEVMSEYLAALEHRLANPAAPQRRAG